MSPVEPALVFTEPAPSAFDFRSTVRSHGWVMLAPFTWDEERQVLSRAHTLSTGKGVELSLSESKGARPAVKVAVQAKRRLTQAEESEIRRAVRRMLRLDEDLSGFHQMHTKLPGWKLRVEPGGGRLLRCPSLFEDIVCTICTTNIAWSGTLRMVARLVEELGEPVLDGRRAFPRPEAIAAAGEDRLREDVRLGYRAAYVWELAAGVSGGTLHLEALEDPELGPDELRRELLKLKGIGPYGAATLQMILGRYEDLAIDTELRAFVARKYLADQPPTDEQIKAIYEPWGPWKYLAYWFDAP